jgi:transposase
LLCAQGKTNDSVANETGLTGLTVGKWRSRFLATRLKGFEQERRGRPIAPFTLSPAEHMVLETWLRSPESPLGLAQRVRVVLACAEGTSNKAVALATEVSEDAVGDWRSRFLLKRLKGLKPVRLGRPVAPVVLSPDEQLILETWFQSHESPSALARRAAVILACAAGKSNTAVAQETGLSAGRVGKLRRQFLALGLNGLNQRRQSAFLSDRGPQVRAGIAASRV